MIADPDGNNAIVSSIQNQENEKRGLKLSSRIVEIDGTNVEGWQHRKILEKIGMHKGRPLFMLFKEVWCYYGELHLYLCNIQFQCECLLQLL